MNNPSRLYFDFIAFRNKKLKEKKGYRKSFRGVSDIVYHEPFYYAKDGFIWDAFRNKVVDNLKGVL